MTGRARRRIWHRGFLAVIVFSVATAAPAQYVACSGDCNQDGAVTIDELIVAVNIILDQAALDSCRSIDRNDSQYVSIDEIVGAVIYALDGCPSTLIPTPTATPTAECTPVPCGNGSVLYCPFADCPGGCRLRCATPTPLPLCTTGSCPDLVISSAQGLIAEGRACNQPPVGDMGIRVCTANQGDGPAGPFHVRIFGFGGDAYVINGLAAGESDCRLRPYVPDQGGGEVVADSQNEVAESNEGNNVRRYVAPMLTFSPTCSVGPSPTPTPSATPTAQCEPGLVLYPFGGGFRCGTPTPAARCTGDGCPDLSVVAASSVFPQARACNQPPVGDSGLRVCVANKGNGSAGSFYVTVDSSEVYAIDGLGAGETNCQVRPYFGASPMFGTVTADPSDEIAESNEGNNDLRYSIAVLSATPSCTRGVTQTPTPTMGEHACGNTGATCTSTPRPTQTPSHGIVLMTALNST